jgi:hypothetical protein
MVNINYDLLDIIELFEIGDTNCIMELMLANCIILCLDIENIDYLILTKLLTGYRNYLLKGNPIVTHRQIGIVLAINKNDNNKNDNNDCQIQKIDTLYHEFIDCITSYFFICYNTQFNIDNLMNFAYSCAHNDLAETYTLSMKDNNDDKILIDNSTKSKIPGKSFSSPDVCYSSSTDNNTDTSTTLMMNSKYLSRNSRTPDISVYQTTDKDLNNGIAKQLPIDRSSSASPHASPYDSSNATPRSVGSFENNKPYKKLSLKSSHSPRDREACSFM